MLSQSISEQFRQRGLCCLFYLVHTRNVISILERGILSYNKVEEFKMPHESIADSGVQGQRKHLHNFVPLFLARRNPMLWRVQDKPISYVRVRLEVADKDGALFTDGNAACNETQFYSEPSDVTKIPWDVVLGRRWTGKRIVDGKRKRSAEVLVPERIETSYIIDVRCKNRADFETSRDFAHLLVEDPQALAPYG